MKAIRAIITQLAGTHTKAAVIVSCPQILLKGTVANSAHFTKRWRAVAGEAGQYWDCLLCP